MAGFDEIAGLTEAESRPSNFDALAGLSEMEGGHFARTKWANIAASRALRAAAAQADYDKTGKVPEGFKMVFGQIKGGPWEHPIKVAATPAEVAQAAQAMTGQPAAPAQVVRQKVTRMPRPGLGRRKGFFKNLAAGHIKADDLAPEFWTNLHADDKKAVEDALAKAGGVQPVVSDVDFNHMVALLEGSTSFDSMAGLSETHPSMEYGYEAGSKTQMERLNALRKKAEAGCVPSKKRTCGAGASRMRLMRARQAREAAQSYYDETKHRTGKGEVIKGYKLSYGKIVKEQTDDEDMSFFDRIAGLDEGSGGEKRTLRIMKSSHKKFDKGAAKGREAGRADRKAAVATSERAQAKLHGRRSERAKRIGAPGWYTTPDTKKLFGK